MTLPAIRLNTIVQLQIVYHKFYSESELMYLVAPFGIDQRNHRLFRKDGVQYEMRKNSFDLYQLVKRSTYRV